MTETTSPIGREPIRPVTWVDSGCVLLDQRKLPGEETYLTLGSSTEVAAAITDMVVRGAPAIGIAAAYGAVLAVRRRFAVDAEWRPAVEKDLRELDQARPTAANLGWALGRIRNVLEKNPPDPVAAVLTEACEIQQLDIRQNQAMGELGSDLIDGPSEIVTHCNAGALATGGYGTALGVVRSAWERGKLRQVFAGETRPWLQGSRLTAWELSRDGIPVTVVTDSAMAQLFRARQPGWLVVGADRIAANGDVANKIGTYSLALLARAHGAKVMVVAPTSTVDMQCESGANIPIENRAEEEIWKSTGLASAPTGVDYENPAFDVTPANGIDVIVTEKGIVDCPDAAQMRLMMSR
ncbi:MAG: S-methyl-5-thioribose-1-phosphate isomerase [Gammaproteobacteria bacterium]